MGFLDDNIGSVIGGTAGFLVGGPQGAAVGAALGGGADANRTTARSTAAQMSFQERMSNTAYQRAVIDMRKAGINPMMAYKMGGASTPDGSSYQAKNIIEPAVNSAVAMKQLSLQADSTKASIRQSNATAANQYAQAAAVAADMPEKTAKGAVYNILKDYIQDAGTALKTVAPNMKGRP